MAKRAKEDRGRYTAKRKADAVMRLLKGEELDTLSRETSGRPDLNSGSRR